MSASCHLLSLVPVTVMNQVWVTQDCPLMSVLSTQSLIRNIYESLQGTWRENIKSVGGNSQEKARNNYRKSGSWKTALGLLATKEANLIVGHFIRTF